MLERLSMDGKPAGTPTTAPRQPILPQLANADWCVGDAPAQWDVSFTDRLWVSLRRWFGREHATADVAERAE